MILLSLAPIYTSTVKEIDWFMKLVDLSSIHVIRLYSKLAVRCLL